MERNGGAGYIAASMASLSVLVNGNPSEEFSMQRGLRQGNAISLFLFIIVIEALHVMMEEVVEKGLFQVPLVDNDGIQISHLQFADDALFFSNW